MRTSSRSDYVDRGKAPYVTAFLPALVLCLACHFYLLPRAEAAVVPSEQDGEVLQALLLHLLGDPKFDLTSNPTNGAIIVLNARTPEKTGFIQEAQIQSDIRGFMLIGEAESDLRRRNLASDPKADKYDAVEAYYTNLTFDARITVADLAKVASKGRARFADLELIKAYPCARGFVTSFLPGYSKDGDAAVVRAFVGPWPHGATIRALLERDGKTWTVKWYRVARYA